MNALHQAGWALLAMVMLAAPCAGASAADGAAASMPRAYVVDIRNFAFSPRTLTVPAGARVVWTNRDDEPHVITSAGGQFVTSQALDTSDSYAVTFSHAGTYTYYCSIHPMMVGTVIVQ